MMGMTEERAAQIMGRHNMIGISYAEKLGMPSALRALREIPATDRQLEEAVDTHVLIFTFPISIARIVAKTRFRVLIEDGPDNSRGDCWLRRSLAVAEIGWHLIRKKPLAGSRGMTWEQQRALVREGETIPRVETLVYAIVGQCLTNAEMLFPRDEIRCTHRNQRDCIGVKHEGGLRLLPGFPDFRDEEIVVTSSKKLVPANF